MSREEITKDLKDGDIVTIILGSGNYAALLLDHSEIPDRWYLQWLNKPQDLSTLIMLGVLKEISQDVTMLSEKDLELLIKPFEDY